MSRNMCTTWVVPSRYITSATRLTLARYNESGIMNKYVSPRRSAPAATAARGEKVDEMDAALMVFVNCLGAVIMVSVVGFHYLTAKPKDAEL
ncbi:Oligosaccaryltransferase [Phytophthora cactorum]|nr:Oligosaccaryltransferase [Phytophthora cactorum]